MDKRHALAKVPLIRELSTLRALFPDAHVEIDRTGKLIWRDWLAPSPLSHAYLVEITWDGVRTPRTVVLEPTLGAPEGKALQHVYNDGSLCLFMPRGWRPTMSIASTIIPWTMRWLFHHEIYLFTGEWTGGGHGTPIEGKTQEDSAA